MEYTDRRTPPSRNSLKSFLFGCLNILGNSQDYAQNVEALHNLFTFLQKNGPSILDKNYLKFYTRAFEKIISFFNNTADPENQIIAMKIIASVSKIEDLPEYWENPLQQKSFVKRSLFDNLMQESSLNILFQSLSFSDETIVNDSYSILELLCRGSRQRTALIYQLNIINYFPQTPNCNFGNILFDIISLLQIEITMPIRQLIHSMLLSTNCNHIQSALKIYNLAFSRKIVPLIEDVSSQYEPISRILLSKIPSIVVAALFLVNKFSILSDDVLFAVAISINTPGIKAPTKAISILRKFFGRLVELRNPIILSSLINSLQFSQFKLKLKVLKFLDMYAQFADFNDNSYIDTLMGFLDDSQLSFYALKILCVAFGQYESRGRVCDFYSVAKQFEESIIQILIGDNEVNSQLAQIIEPP